MNKEAFQNENNIKVGGIPELDIPASNERIYNDAQQYLDPESIRRFCQTWGEVGRAILGRRNIITA
jgi:hypothetical protein